MVCCGNKSCKKYNPNPPHTWTRERLSFPCNTNNVKYAQLTKRRKCEILSFKTVGNHPTKKEIFARAMRSNGRIKVPSGAKLTKKCNNGRCILVYDCKTNVCDQDVPLYMYATPIYFNL